MDKEEFTIDCVGKDGKMHRCLPEADKTLCGMDIQTKKPGRDDQTKRYSCYPCTY